MIILLNHRTHVIMQRRATALLFMDLIRSCLPGAHRQMVAVAATFIPPVAVAGLILVAVEMVVGDIPLMHRVEKNSFMVWEVMLYLIPMRTIRFSRAVAVVPGMSIMVTVQAEPTGEGL